MRTQHLRVAPPSRDLQVAIYARVSSDQQAERHTIAREALRRSPRADPVLKDSSRSGRARPVQDGVHHGQAMQGTPTPQP